MSKAAASENPGSARRGRLFWSWIVFLLLSVVVISGFQMVSMGSQIAQHEEATADMLLEKGMAQKRQAELRVQADELRSPDRLEAAALELGMRPPELSEIEILE